MSGRAGHVVDSVVLTFTKGGMSTNSNHLGSQNPRTNYSVAFPDEVLGYAQVDGEFPEPTYSAESTIFGFRPSDSY